MLPAVRIAYHMMASPVGLLFLARTDQGLRYLQFMEKKSLKRMIAARSDIAPEAKWEPSLLDLKPVVEQLDAYFNGMLHVFDVPLDAVGSDFQKKVWNALYVMAENGQLNRTKDGLYGVPGRVVPAPDVAA